MPICSCTHATCFRFQCAPSGEAIPFVFISVTAACLYAVFTPYDAANNPCDVRRKKQMLAKRGKIWQRYATATVQDKRRPSIEPKTPTAPSKLPTMRLLTQILTECSFAAQCCARQLASKATSSPDPGNGSLNSPSPREPPSADSNSTLALLLCHRVFPATCFGTFLFNLTV